MSTSSRDAALSELLLSLFDAEQLSRFVRLNFGNPVANALPAATASAASLADHAVDELTRRGDVNGFLFEQLRREHPGRHAEITALEQRYVQEDALRAIDLSTPATKGGDRTGTIGPLKSVPLQPPARDNFNGGGSVDERAAARSGYDLFISHASEDKPGFVEPLVVALRNRGVSVWYDRFELKLGDDLRRKVDEGLRECRYGVVVLSPAFLGKRWPEAELSALFALEGDGRKRILPVRHRLTHEDLTRHSPLMGGRLTAGDETGMAGMVDQIMAVLEEPATVMHPRGVSAADANVSRALLPFSVTPVGGRAPDLRAKMEQLLDAREAARSEGRQHPELTDEIKRIKRSLRHRGAPREGDIFGERFVLQGLIGKGGFGTVWRATDLRQSRRLVALKVAHPERAAHPRDRERFFRGARGMASLNHPGIVRLVDIGPQEPLESCWYAMDLYPRGDIHRLRMSGQLGPEEASLAVMDAAQGLIAAHAAGLLHRDVKPHNVLVDTDGHGRLTDFDLVLDAESTGGTATLAAMGTLMYAAPEQLSDASKADARADIYGLGMTLLFCWHGRDPTMGELMGDRGRWTRAVLVPRQFRTPLERAVDPDPQKRHQTVQDLVDDLKRAADASSFPVLRQGPADRVPDQVILARHLADLSKNGILRFVRFALGQTELAIQLSDEKLDVHALAQRASDELLRLDCVDRRELHEHKTVETPGFILTTQGARLFNAKSEFGLEHLPRILLATANTEPVRGLVSLLSRDGIAVTHDTDSESSRRAGQYGYPALLFQHQVAWSRLWIYVLSAISSRSEVINRNLPDRARGRLSGADLGKRGVVLRRNGAEVPAYAKVLPIVCWDDGKEGEVCADIAHLLDAALSAP